MPEGGGRNVVNVMLVDFRGFDTLGEITVLGDRRADRLRAAAALPAGAREHRAARQQRVQNACDDARPDRQLGDTSRDYLMRARGDHAPGCSRSIVVVRASTCSCAATTCRAAASWPGSRMAIALHPAIHGRRHALGGGAAAHPARCAGSPSACSVAAATGAGAWLFGYPFLTSHTALRRAAAASARCRMPSAMFFDLGVFALVVGATLLMLIALAHQSIRAPRAARDRLPRPAPTEDG